MMKHHQLIINKLNMCSVVPIEYVKLIITHDWSDFSGNQPSVNYSALFSQRYGVEKLLGGVKDLLLPGILLGMLDHQEE